MFLCDHMVRRPYFRGSSIDSDVVFIVYYIPTLEERGMENVRFGFSFFFFFNRGKIYFSASFP